MGPLPRRGARPAGIGRRAAQFAGHPRLRARGRWREAPSSAGPLRALLPPATLDGAEPRMDAVPEVGEHTDAILAELGYAPGVVATWRASGVV